MVGKIGHKRIHKQRQIPPFPAVSIDLDQQIDTERNRCERKSKGRKKPHDPIYKSRHIYDRPVYDILISKKFTRQQAERKHPQQYFAQNTEHIRRIRRKKHIQHRIQRHLGRQIIPADPAQKRDLHPMGQKAVGIFQHLKLGQKQIHIVVNRYITALPVPEKHTRRQQEKPRHREQKPVCSQPHKPFAPRQILHLFLHSEPLCTEGAGRISASALHPPSGALHAGLMLLRFPEYKQLLPEKVQHDKHAHAKEHGHVIHDYLRL